MADLESALHYSLRVEATRASSLSGAQLAAFKCYVATLVKVRSSGCQQRNCLCLHVSIYEMQTHSAGHHALVVTSSEAWRSQVWALCPDAECILWLLTGSPRPCGSINSAQSPTGS